MAAKLRSGRWFFARLILGASVIGLGILIVFNPAESFGLDESLPPIKIGATVALTGKLAFLGKTEAKALEMGIADINSRGGVNGRKLLLFIEDNQGEPKNAVVSVSKLLQVDKVDIIFSAFTHVTQAVKDLVKSAHKFMLYHASAGDIVQSSPLFFRDYGDAEESGVALATHVQGKGFKRLGFMSEIGDFCFLSEKGFLSQYPATVAPFISRQNYNPGETDLRPLLLRLRAEKPDGLVLCTWRDTQLVMKQLKELDMLHIPTFQFHAPFLPSSDSPETRVLLEANATITTWYGIVKGESTPDQEAFIERFTKESGEAPILPDAAFAYDDIGVLAKALASCVQPRDLSLDCLAEKMLVTDYVGLAGPIRFTKNRVSNRPVLLIAVKNGEWNQIER